MIRIVGEIVLYLALCSALIQTLLPALGYRNKNVYLLACAPSFAILQALFVLSAITLLISGFVSDDFSIAFVAENSHSDLPLFYKLTAVWGGHEGSILLWIALLNLWTVIFVKLNRTYQDYHLVVLLLGMISFCFLCFICFTSNPFAIALTQTGQDLNPLLQDPGFLIHPPVLYLGYVGMSLPFCLTLAGLINHSINVKWASLTRSYTIAAWCFLTLGITLGSWWAYRVLGWGGFWFWDPVENASLLPWLNAVALIHILVLVEKRSAFLSLAALLAITSFSLSVLCTFLVRSGILVSAHTFANDPKRGVFLLALLAIIILFAFYFYLRYHFQKSKTQTSLKLISREMGLLFNVLFVLTALGTVLLGTLYPLILDALQLGNVSVGAPYFNKVLLPLVLTMMFFMGVSIFLQWQENNWHTLRTTLLYAFLAATICTALTSFVLATFTITNLVTLFLCFWIIVSLFKTKLKSLGMVIAHGGFAILILGIVLSNELTIEKQVSLRPGNAVSVGPYQFFFVKAQSIFEQNYHGIRATFDVMKGIHHIAYIYPEKRIYPVREMIMTSVDIHAGIFRDLYIALGQPLEHDYWSVKVYYKPFVRWIWGGGVMMMIGGFCLILQRRLMTK